MKENTFLKKTLLLIMSNLITGVLGFILSIILSRKLGPEGMGLYSLVFPINSLLLSIISGGMMIAVSKVVAEYEAKSEYNNIKKCIRTTLLFNLILSGLIILTAYLFSFQISKYAIKDLRTLYALRLVFISSIFMTLSNTYKGYFFGTMKVVTPGIIDIFEKAIRILLILILFKANSYNDLTSLVTVGFLVFCIGELASLIIFFMYYHYDQKEFPITNETLDSVKKLLNKLLLISIPLMITELISSSLYTVSTLIMPRRLVAGGISYSDALSMIGKFTGMAMNIVFFPMIIIGSISIVLIPDLTSSLSKQATEEVDHRIRSVFNTSFLIGIIVLLICLIFGEQLGRLLFKRDDLGDYIRFLAFCAPFIYTSVITRSILNGLGKQNIILRNSIIFSVIQVIMLYVLIGIPSINIYGLGITILVTSILTIIINIIEIKKTTSFKMFA